MISRLTNNWLFSHKYKRANFSKVIVASKITALECIWIVVPQEPLRYVRDKAIRISTMR